ncbi:MAG: hypothetical protein AAF266_07610, partial [Planctomycetota bacterium]
PRHDRADRGLQDATVAYTLSEAEYSDGSNDFFTRTDGSNISGGYSVAGFGGNSFFAAQDLDGDGTNPATMTFTLGITGLENLSFAALFAEDDDGSAQDWDGSDGFTVTANIDGNGPVLVFAIEAGGDLSNEVPQIDTDLDGIGDGAEITDTFTSYGAAIPGTGDTLELVLTFDLNAGDEDLAIDDLTISGDLAVIPEPTAALFGTLLASALGLTVSRRPSDRC